MNFVNYLVAFLAFVIASCMAGSYPVKYAENGDDSVPQASEYRDKREHGHGVTGPVHTFVKTDKHANFKWGVRHHVGHHYAGRR